MCCDSLPCIAYTGTDACCPGSAGDSYCAGLLGAGAVCDGTTNTCSSCGPVSSNTYCVDPVNGSDATGNGSGQTSGGNPAPGCAFQTVTRALQVLQYPASATTIVIVGPSTAGPLETFPWNITPNITLTTEANSGAVTVDANDVPASESAAMFLYGNDTVEGSAGASLTITNSMGGTSVGINSYGGNNTVENLTVTGLANHGLEVDQGTLTVGPGVTANANGSSGSSSGQGLFVNGTAVAGATPVAVVTVPTGSAQTTFDGNGQHGILVTGGGGLMVDGDPTGNGTITANGNYLAGVWIEQSGTTIPAITINGVVANGSTNGNGVHIFGGSNVTVTSSTALSNHGNGVQLSASHGGSTDISNINLGSPGAPGDNTLQAAASTGMNNQGVGVCLNIGATGLTVLAEGNVFANANCETGGTLWGNPSGCTGSAAVCTSSPTGVCDIGTGGAGAASNTVDVAGCTSTMYTP
jgi:hypothetical protein